MLDTWKKLYDQPAKSLQSCPTLSDPMDCSLPGSSARGILEYIMWNAGLDEAQAGIKIAGRNINSLTYADDTTLTAESGEELKSLLMKVKEDSEKASFKLNIQKSKNMVSSPITSWQIEGKWKQWQILFLGLQNHCWWWLQPWS